MAAGQTKDAGHRHQTDLYTEAVQLYKANKYGEAIALYQSHLQRHPADATATAALAVAMAACASAAAEDGGDDCSSTRDTDAATETNAYEEAIALARRAVQLSPSDAKLRHTLGRLYEKATPRPRWGEAAEAYGFACEKDPTNVRLRLDHAKALKEAGRLAAAAEAYGAAAALDPTHPRAHFRRGMALRALGRRGAAADALRRHLELDPEHTAAKFWLAALTGDAAAAAACPPDMVAGLFDEYAERFDEHLVGALQYRTPALLCDLLVSTAAPGARWRRCADLGCGTGLMGPLLRPLAARLEGVDLSKLMCQKARGRGCYDEVEDGEIVAWLDGRAKQQQDGSSSGGGSGSSSSGGGGGFDLLVAADVLVYIGDLSALFAAAAAASEPGALFALSTELLPAGAEHAEATGYALQPTGRYAHSAAYLRKTAAACGWAVDALAESVIRMNAAAPIHGNLCVLRRLVRCGDGE